MEERWDVGMGMEGMGRWACDSARFRFLFLFYMDISLLKTPPGPSEGAARGRGAQDLEQRCEMIWDEV